MAHEGAPELAARAVLGRAVLPKPDTGVFPYDAVSRSHKSLEPESAMLVYCPDGQLIAGVAGDAVVDTQGGVGLPGIYSKNFSYR
jgi:hypothetical protein